MGNGKNRQETETTKNFSIRFSTALSRQKMYEPANRRIEARLPDKWPIKWIVIQELEDFMESLEIIRNGTFTIVYRLHVSPPERPINLLEQWHYWSPKLFMSKPVWWFCRRHIVGRHICVLSTPYTFATEMQFRVLEKSFERKLLNLFSFFQLTRHWMDQPCINVPECEFAAFECIFSKWQLNR